MSGDNHDCPADMFEPTLFPVFRQMLMVQDRNDENARATAHPELRSKSFDPRARHHR